MLTLLNGDLYEKPEDAPSVSAYTQGENQGVLLVNMMGVDYDDPLWDSFIDQLTIEEMASLISNNFGTDEYPPSASPPLPPATARTASADTPTVSPRNMARVCRPRPSPTRACWPPPSTKT